MGNNSGPDECQECPRGFSSLEGATACVACSPGWIDADVGCAQCAAGTFATSTSLTACVPCDTGRYQEASGKSACTSCSDVLDSSGRNAHLWTTMEPVAVEGQVEWREISGSGDVSQCGCRAGAWVDDQGHCHECGQGIICHGMGVMEVLPGYFASPFRGDFVWQCHGEDWKRCPGGDPGTCAEHRINTSIACDECEPFTRMTNDGPCEQCTGPDVGLLVAVLVVVVAFLWCVYWVSAKENRRERKNVFTLAAIVGSQFVTLFQMVGALASLSVAWPEPFARIVKLGSLVNFRLEVLNLGCVVATRPLQRYTATALIVVVLILCMVLFHFLYLLFFRFEQCRRAQLRQFNPALQSAVGTVLLAVFISVCSGIVQPFVCKFHPNGLSTMQGYGQTVCWNSKYSQDHEAMVMVSAIMSCVPCGFLSLCLWVRFSLPHRLIKGDVKFLETFSFLFFRFRPGAYSYPLALLLRNLGLALVPVIVDETLQLSAVAIVVMMCVLYCASVLPWAVPAANYLDIVLHTGFLFIVFLAALQTDIADDIVVGNMLLTVFSGVLCGFLGAGLYCVRLYWLRSMKPFQFFLCHHKEGGGAFCRLLKMRFTCHQQVKRGVFLDSDNLQDLSMLFSIVANNVDTLVVLCTREILFRPWCVGEMTTARLHGIDTVMIIFPDFRCPSRAFIENYATHVEGVLSLAPYGISPDVARETLLWLSRRPLIVLPHFMSLVGVDACVEKMVLRNQGRSDMVRVSGIRTVSSAGDANVADGAVPVSIERTSLEWLSSCSVAHHVTDNLQWGTMATTHLVSIVDHRNLESVCTALIVQELLKTRYPLTGAGHVVGPDESLPEGTTSLLVVCSTGCFQRPSFVRQLFEAETRGVVAIPIIADGSFQFPSDAMYQELLALSPHILQDLGRDATDLIALIRSLFEEIAINVRPQDTHGVLEVRASTIADRLSTFRRPLRLLPTSSPASRAQAFNADSLADVIHLDVSDEPDATVRIKL